MKRKWIILCLIAVFVVATLFYADIQRKHTFTLAATHGAETRSEQIQPLFGTVKVSGDCDTDVIFTDIETGETYAIGYITQGVSGKIQLQTNRWYTVEGAGNLTIGPVNVRVE